MAGTSADRSNEHARATSNEMTNQKGTGIKQVLKGPAYGGGLKQYGKGTKKITQGK